MSFFFWPLCCLLFDLCLLITPLVSSKIVLSVVWFTSSNYPFGIFKLLAIVLSVVWFTSSNYPFGIFKLLDIVLSVVWITSFNYPFGIFKLFFFFFLRLLLACYFFYQEKFSNMLYAIARLFILKCKSYMNKFYFHIYSKWDHCIIHVHVTIRLNKIWL